MSVLCESDPRYGGKAFLFHCPGCRYAHIVHVDGCKNESGATWTWNGDMDKPTFSPSLLVNASHPGSRCHSFVRDGKIQFLADCFHKLRGQTVDLLDFDAPEPAEAGA